VTTSDGTVQGVEKPMSAEMHPGAGFRIRSAFERPPAEIVAGFASFETPSVSDLMNRLYTMVPSISNRTDPSLRVLGPRAPSRCTPATT